MRELERVRRALAGAADRKEAALVATVLSVDGSVYRGVGARMVVLADGATAGAVSGGCLEADIVARAEQLTMSRATEVIQYDTRSSSDAVLGLGLGCQGVIDVLLEPLVGETLRAAISFYERLTARRDPTVVVTLVRARPGSADVVGRRAVFDEAGALLEGDAGLLDRDETEVSREIVRPAVPFLICGAGADAQPVATLAADVGFHVTVVDHRAAFATAVRFPDADVVLHVNAAEDALALRELVAIDERTAAVVMAHSATHDRAYLRAALQGGAGYVGVLGPRRRMLELLGDPTGDGRIPPSIHSPVGLDLGAETPEEIALAIVAEVSAVMAGRRGGFLRERPGPIHPDRARAEHFAS